MKQMKNEIDQFVSRIPLFREIPDSILAMLDTSEFHLPPPGGEVESMRLQLEQELNCFVMTYDAGVFNATVPAEKHLCANLKGARLTVDQQLHLRRAEEALSPYRVSFVAYAKPLVFIKPENSSLFWSKVRVSRFLQAQKLAVIATSHITEPTPESALVAFADDDELCLYFQTGRHTRKARNVLSNPAVSFVIGMSAQDFVTIQYEGTARQLIGRVEVEDCWRRFAAKSSPTTEEYIHHPESVFFKVTPTWIRYSNYSVDNPGVVQVDLTSYE
jgi:general stress protein 26